MQISPWRPYMKLWKLQKSQKLQKVWELQNSGKPAMKIDAEIQN